MLLLYNDRVVFMVGDGREYVIVFIRMDILNDESFVVFCRFVVDM